jgi:hypothetical protein
MVSAETEDVAHCRHPLDAVDVLLGDRAERDPLLVDPDELVHCCFHARI